MKNYKDSDYALNKHSNGIVYRFANETVTITLDAYLADNPNKTIADFRKLKEISDGIYFEQDRNGYSQTYKNTSLTVMEKSVTSHEPSPEDLILNAIEGQEKTIGRKKRLSAVIHALDKLTDIQRRRYIMSIVEGLSTWQIAEKENVNQKTVYESLQAAEIKIKKFLKKI